MSKVYTDRNIDFNNEKYIVIKAKQYDRSSRYIRFTCFNDGNLVRLNKNENTAYVRYKKADEYGVFNECEITDDGKIIVELTEQMLAYQGNCSGDLVVLEGISTYTVSEDGKLQIDSLNVISTMNFNVNVVKSPLENSEIESTYEMDALNKMYDMAMGNFQDLLDYTTDASQAIVEIETALRNYVTSASASETNAKASENAAKASELASKASENAAKASETASKTSETNSKASELASKASENAAKTSETNAKTSEDNAKDSEDNAKDSETNAKTSEDNAKDSETNAKTSEDNAKDSEDNAKASELAAKTSETNAKTSEDNAKDSEDNAKDSEDNAAEYAKASKSYAEGTTDYRVGEATDNSKYYYQQIQLISTSIGGAFKPKGTIPFAQLSSQTVQAGYVYIISDSFTTDSTFKDGGGVSRPSGTAVYYTVDNLWDCMPGVMSGDVSGLQTAIDALTNEINTLKNKTVLIIDD